EFQAEDSLVALFRAEPTAVRDEILGAVRGCLALARELANLEGLLGLDRSPIGAPLYSAAPPRTKGQALEQGSRVAAGDRPRLGERGGGRGAAATGDRLPCSRRCVGAAGGRGGADRPGRSAGGGLGPDSDGAPPQPLCDRQPSPSPPAAPVLLGPRVRARPLR